MTKEEKIEKCPFCDFTARGNIAAYNIKQHVEKYHPAKYDAWMQGLPPPEPKPKIQTGPTIHVESQPLQPNVTLKPIQGTPQEDIPQDPVLQPTRKLPVYKGQLEPEEWLRQFLSSYKFKQTFVDTLSEYVKYRKQLPAGAQLTQDIKDMDSGISNLRHAAMIAEIYENELRQYMMERQREVEAAQRPYQGVPLNQWGQPQSQPQGFSVPNQPPSQGYQGIPVNPWYPQQQQQYQQQFPQYMQQDRIARLEDQLRIRDEDARRKQDQEMLELKMQLQQAAQGPQRDPYMERMEGKMDMMEEERRRKQDEELQIMKMQIQRGGMNAQDVQNMIAAERGKITGDDIRRMIDQSISNKGSMTETELKYAESKDKFTLEKMKLDEGAKTRDTIATAVKGGFASVGQAIARTAQEVGSEKQTPIIGQYDGKHTWQLNCPSCGGVITAPMAAKVVSCPTCGGDFEVLPQQPEQTLPPQSAGFTVKQDIDPILQQEAPEPTPEPTLPERKQIPERRPIQAEPIKIQTTIEQPPERKIPERTPTAPDPRAQAPPERKTPTAADQAGQKPKKKKKEKKKT